MTESPWCNPNRPAELLFGPEVRAEVDVMLLWVLGLRQEILLEKDIRIEI